MTVLLSEFEKLRNDRNTQIGSICHQWAHLEWILAIVIWRLLRVDDVTGRIITGGLDILPRTNMAIALAEYLKAPAVIRRALRDTRTTLQEGLNERRNQAIHGLRFTNPDDQINSELFVMYRGRNAGAPRPISNKDLKQLWQDVIATQLSLLEAATRSGLLSAPSTKPARTIAPKVARSASPKESTSKS